jgi:hypothetical protein
MATMNTLKRKHLENENKMHFTSLWQHSAHSNSTSNNLNKIIVQVHHHNTSLAYFQLVSCC